MNELNKRIKQIIALVMVLLFLPSMSSLAASSKEIARSTRSDIFVNDIDTYFEAYNINDNNYFKLRDIAQGISGTEKQFEVSWDDEERTISLLSGEEYTSVGGELEKGDGKDKTGSLNTSRVLKDGKEVELKAYTINDNNYFKLRDIGEAFDIGVIWDEKAKTIRIDTSTGYISQEELAKAKSKEMEKEVIRLINIERKEAGLEPFEISNQVTSVARIKSEDMAINSYFAHVSPTYGSLGEMMTSHEVPYRAAGENIAMGHRTPESVVEGWMDSPGHRANILNTMFNKIGVGLYQTNNGTNIWTQMFTN